MFSLESCPCENSSVKRHHPIQSYSSSPKEGQPLRWDGKCHKRWIEAELVTRGPVRKSSVPWPVEVVWVWFSDEPQPPGPTPCDDGTDRGGGSGGSSSSGSSSSSSSRSRNRSRSRRRSRIRRSGVVVVVVVAAAVHPILYIEFYRYQQISIGAQKNLGWSIYYNWNFKQDPPLLYHQTIHHSKSACQPWVQDTPRSCKNCWPPTSCQVLADLGFLSGFFWGWKVGWLVGSMGLVSWIIENCNNETHMIRVFGRWWPER